jgi:adenylate cyclase
LCVFGCILIYRALAYHLFIDHLFWLPVVTPVFAALLACHGATMTYRVVVEQQEKRRIKSVFSKVVSPDVVNELLEAEHLALGGAQRRVTIFFADVRGFTELTDSAQARAEEYVRKHNLTGRAAEDYYDEQAGELLGTVNLYLSLVASTVKRHGGTLDKYIGDCVMAFWGAPILNEKHALTCVRTAIATQLAIFKLNAEREMENRRREQENVKRAAAKLPQLPLLSLLMLGSGINTGTVTVGLMGSEEHQLNYTVFGREVNLASRLESVSGRGRVIIGEATYEDLKRDDPALAASCLPQPTVTVKGFRKPVQIYEVPWRPPERAGGPSG